MNINQEIKKFQQEFKRQGNKKRAQESKRYVRSIFKFYGANSKAVQELVKRFAAENPDISKKDLWQLVNKLWQSGWHELRALAVNLLRKYSKLLNYSDLPKVEKLIRGSINWDQIDEISVHLVGPILLQDQRVYQDLKRWSKDKNFWVRRSALLGQLGLFRKKLGNRKLFYQLAEKMMDESWQNFESWAGNHPERMGRWFIRKTIGWVLRELSEKYPEEVFKFLKKNKNKMASLSFREGGRKLPNKYKKQLGVK